MVWFGWGKSERSLVFRTFERSNQDVKKLSSEMVEITGLTALYFLSAADIGYPING